MFNLQRPEAFGCLLLVLCYCINGRGENSHLSSYHAGISLNNLSQEFQKALGSKHSVYDTTARTGRALKDKTTLKDDNQKLDDMLSELRDRWDTVCGKSVER